MSDTIKQVYIPELNITGAFMEEIGSAEDRVIYPGVPFDVKLSAEDFSDPEEYHATWISVTRAVKAKLNKNATSKSS
jgi:hypothetical protein